MNKDSFVMRQSVDMLNGTLKECIANLKAIEHKWNEYTDLKLHDISYHGVDIEIDGFKITASDTEFENLFQWFCEFEYDTFLEDMQERVDGFEEFIERIGRTSKFYIGGTHLDGSTEEWLRVIAYICNDYNLSNICENVEGDKITIDVDESLEYFEDVEEFVGECLALVESLRIDVKEWIDNVNYMYDYIEDFKKNQCEYFEEYVKDYIRDNVL